MRSPTPRGLALTDQIRAALKDDAGTAADIARRVGRIACYCAAAGAPGEIRATTDKPIACRCALKAPGWWPATHADVRPILERLVKAGDAERTTTTDRRRVVYSATLGGDPDDGYTDAVLDEYEAEFAE